MAYNLEPLIRILQKILNPDQKRWILDHKKPQIESLLEKASSLKQILQNFSPATGQITESLESQIRDAAHKAEDLIEPHMFDQMLSRPGGESFTVSPPDLQQVIQELDSAMERVMKIMDGNQMVTSSTTGFSFTPDLSSKNIVLGLDEDLIQLKDRLTGQQSKLHIIPIVGMGGVGKTTLARNLYNDPLIVSYFDTRAWITVSQDYNVRAILLGLLGCIDRELISKVLKKKEDELQDILLEKKDDELQGILYKCLYGRRYLIVLDDIWSANAWDDIKMCFPSNAERSRIMLTTRESNVGKYADSESLQHQMHLLNESESWDLLRLKVFGKENCPAALERIGRNIAKNCAGLPLAIHVIGGLLSRAKRTEDFWDDVANDVKAAVAANDEFSNIFCLSYNYLPNHVKPCFLYMGAFPEDYEIRASHVIRLWVAEGFLKSNADKSLEEDAEDCLKALVDRNLISIRELKSNGKPKSYSIHDLLRDQCMKKADEEKFLHVKNRFAPNIPKDSLYSLRRVSAHESNFVRDLYASIESISLVRSFLFTSSAAGADLNAVLLSSRLLRVLDAYNISFKCFPKQILQLVNIRYLALSCNSGLPSAISRFLNLQTLIARLHSSMSLPRQIWGMPELRHFKCENGYWKSGAFHFDSSYRVNFVLEKLETISTANLNDLIESGILGSIPNIKNLGIICFRTPSSVVDLCHLQKLETLKCSSDLVPRSFLSTLRLPPSLRKLTLAKCYIPQRLMTTLCALQNLEVLKFRYCFFLSEDWEATEGEEFCSLQFLLLEGFGPTHWRADQTNFPRLRHLVIRHCSELKEIPCGIGEIPTLETIEVDKCSPSVVASAKKIQEEQRELGNCDLEVRIC